MKKLLIGMTLLASINSHADSTIIFEESTTTTKKLTIINNGQQELYGSIDLARAPRTYSAGRVRIGDNVITSDKRHGVVKSMFVSSNKVVVNDRYYGNRTWTLSDIAVTSGCATRSLCVNDDVITSDKRSGTIAGYFGDGTIVVNDRYYGNRIFNQKDIALTDGCSSLFCKGDSVITSDNRSGVVSGFFGDGTIIVNNEYYGNRVFNQDDISITEGVCSNIYVDRLSFCR